MYPAPAPTPLAWKKSSATNQPWKSRKGLSVLCAGIGSGAELEPRVGYKPARAQIVQNLGSVRDRNRRAVRKSGNAHNTNLFAVAKRVWHEKSSAIAFTAIIPSGETEEAEMLKRISVKNFYSIYEELDISLLMNQRVPADYRSLVAADGARVGKVLALIGANGSGKTTLLKSLAFVHWFVSHSFVGREPQAEIPLVPHFLGADEPTEFSIEFEFRGVKWRYDLKLNKQRVLHESLHRYEYRFVYVFKRDWQEEAQQYQVVSKPEFDFPAREAQRARGNASLLATAAQFNVPLAVELTQLNIVSNITESGKYSFDSVEQLLGAAEFLHDRADSLQSVSRLLSAWDLGLSGVEIVKHKVPDPKGKDKEQTVFMPVGQHTIGTQKFSLSLFSESSGTRSAFALLSKVLPVLEEGGLAVIDELESDLHPHMLSAFLDLFISPETNPHHAQLLFSTHSHEILNTLMKEQILLVEKDENLNTDAFRLDEVEGVRSDDNFYAKYMAGAYGAVPEI